MANFRVIYEENNKEYIFSAYDFRVKASEYISQKRKSDKYTQKELFETIADKTHVSFEAVKQWYSGNNGPADIEIVKTIASVLEIDFKRLIVAKERENNMEIKKVDFSQNLSEKELIIQVYQMMLELVREWATTGGGAYIIEDSENRDGKAIYSYYIKRCDDIHYEIDRYALVINKDTLEKLHLLVMELKQMIDESECPIRWTQANGHFYYATHILTFCSTVNDMEGDDNVLGLTDARIYLFDGDSDTEALAELMTRRVSGMDVYRDIHYKVDMSDEDRYETIHRYYLSVLGLLDEPRGDYPYPQDQGAVTSLRELYMHEFVETMRILFGREFGMEL